MYHTINWDEKGLFKRMEVEMPADDSASVGEKMLLYWLIRELKPQIVIETGTHRGLSSLFMAHAIFDNQNGGHLHTADPFDWGQVGNFAKFPELSEVITFYQQEGSKMIDKLSGIDFAFIDGYHGIEDVIPEIKQLLPKLSPNATVVFHDCWYNNSDGVNEALEACELKSIWLPTQNAIRIYQKQTGNPEGREGLYGK